MAPRKGTPVRAPLPQSEASSRPSSKPEIEQESKKLDARVPDYYLETIKVQVLSPRVAEPNNPDGPPPFEWDKRLDDKRQYERQRYFRHDFPHHRLSHDIFDTLMLDTAHDASLGHRSVPMELAHGYEANTISGENMISSDIHIAIVSQQPGLTEKKAKADGDAEIETQTFFDSSSTSSLPHQLPSAAKHDTPPQLPVTSCTLNSTCSSKSTKTPIQIRPVPNQIIFQHPHDKSSHSTNTYTTHAINHTNTTTTTTTKDTTQLASLALFICIICFFICGWQACTSWRELRHRRHRQRILLSRHTHRGRGRGRQQRQRPNGCRSRSSSDSCDSSDIFTDDDPETGLGGMVEMADLAPFADVVGVEEEEEEEGKKKKILGGEEMDRYRDFPIDSPLEPKGKDV